MSSPAVQSAIRNFSIIAHIDHGKSTLADRFLELTDAISVREQRDQVLDNMDLERERGITIKAHAVRLRYIAKDGKTYYLHLIDTPGHVDFSYEVSRSLAACEGVLLLVDASQGVQAQTIANAHLAIENNLEILPVINKIDLPNANIDKISRQMTEILGLDHPEFILTSAKKGIGIREALEAVVRRIPPPVGDLEAPLKALIFDSWFDNYQGVVVLIRVIDGSVRPGNKIKMMASGKTFEVGQVGFLTPKMTPVQELKTGEVGYLVAAIKEVEDTKVGDTITDAITPTASSFPGYREVKPMVFCGLHTIESHQFEELRDALQKLKLNDSSFVFEPETSLALGFGFRCGFLGLLHMEIIQERLEREYKLNLISTAPSVVYRLTLHDGKIEMIDNPSRLPDPQSVASFEEPFIKATILTPNQYVGPMLTLCEERRGIQKDLTYLDTDRVMVVYELPLNEVILDFYDRMKSMSRGYASLDYDHLGFRDSDLVRVDILLNGESVDALSFVTHRSFSYTRARVIAEKLKEIIPQQMFEVAIQAAIGSKVIARETVKPLRKNVTAKCYGGDITRKRKLWEKQKEGKKRMKQVGRIEVPQEAFLALLKIKD
jgi:GTP-binding protein LepA